MSGPLKLAVEELGCVMNKLPPSRREFARSLCDQFRTRGLTERQTPWVSKLIEIAKTPETPRETVDVGEMEGVIGLFDKAREHLKQPRIVLALENRKEVRLSIAGQRAFAPGSVNVTDVAPFGEASFYGRIYRDGRFEKSPRCEMPAGVIELLKRFAEQPAEVAAEYGRLTGRCCFCSTELNDERSTAVGYGRTCASHYALPWGAKR